MIFRSGRLLQAAALLVLGAGCSTDRASAPNLPDVSLCHVSGATGTIETVAASAVANHVAHGDYLVNYAVGGPAGDSTRFNKIETALAKVRAGRLTRGETTSAACQITITVAAGVVRGTTTQTNDTTLEHFPLAIDVPGISLIGAYAIPASATGRAIRSDTGVATTLAPNEPLPIVGGATSQLGSSTPIILADAHPNGSTAAGLVVRGFVFRSGHPSGDTTTSGKGVLTIRVDNVQIVGNRFETGFTEPIDLRGGGGIVRRNQVGGVSNGGTCDVCIIGPGTFTISDNLILAGGIPGILTVPAAVLPVPDGIEQYVLPASATVVVDVGNNEVRDHLRVPVGVGVRIGAVGINAPNVFGTSRATIHDNLIVHNNFAVIVEAAFPVANSALRGDVDATLKANTIQLSCQNDLLVSFSRHTTALGLSNVPYLKNSVYSLTLNGNIDWNTAWFSDPSGFGNVLNVDGVAVPNGARQAYDASKTC